jgi:hypothetical protein
MATPNAHGVVQNSNFSAGDINQFLGTHAITYCNQGATQVSYTTTGGASVLKTFSGAAQWLAQPFSTGASQTTISRIELYFSGSTTSGVDTTLELRTDNAGVPSNTTLYSVAIPSDFQNAGGPIIWVSIPCTVTGLTAATKYHIVVDGQNSGTSNIALSWATNTTSVNQGVKSASGTSGWSVNGNTFLFNVFAGANGVLRNTYEDAGARWTGYDYNSSNGNTTVATVREYTTGTLRSVRTLSYTSGALVGVA